MRLEPVQPNRVALFVGYTLAYALATAMLTLILVYWRHVPGWTVWHVIALTASVALVARIVRWWLG